MTTRRSFNRPQPGTRRWIGVGLALLLVAAVGIATRMKLSSHSTQTTSAVHDSSAQRNASEFESETPTASPSFVSPYRNTLPDAVYVGSQACRDCHEEHESSYRRTGMGRSAAEVDVAREPADTTFDHPPSRHRYQVVRRGESLWHRELLMPKPDDTSEVVLSEYPMKYAIGSGHYARTYLYEDDGFLMESPITWFRTKERWDMSPGYDRPDHQGFQRDTGEACLKCHVGSWRTLQDSLHRVEITEAAIGCERCHGPGSLHVEQRMNGAVTTPSGETDWTIVNPARLSRDLSMAICEQCHLHGAATVVRLGKSESDYRPGLRPNDFRHVFRLEPANLQMKVVGHVEQMYLSRCYQQSDTFSCLTCHDPHEAEPHTDPTRRYNAICGQCHAPADCKSPANDRQRTVPQDNCIECHMPRSRTDIPHLSFTSHRVGIYPGNQAIVVGNATETPPEQYVLVPYHSLDHLSPRERRRAYGLAYLEVSNQEDDARRRASFIQRGLALILEYQSSGPSDGIVDAWLARLSAEQGHPDAALLARRALGDPRLTGLEKCNSLFLLADAQVQSGRYREALATLETLNRLRRHSMQWLLVAQCQERLGNREAELQALLEAVRIDPALTDVHQLLAERFREKGDLAAAAWHARRAHP